MSARFSLGMLQGYKAATGAIASPEFSHCSAADLPSVNYLKAYDVTTFHVIALFLTVQVESDTPVNLRVLFGDCSGILVYVSLVMNELSSGSESRQFMFVTCTFITG